MFNESLLTSTISLSLMIPFPTSPITSTPSSTQSNFVPDQCDDSSLFGALGLVVQFLLAFTAFCVLVGICLFHNQLYPVYEFKPPVMATYLRQILISFYKLRFAFINQFIVVFFLSFTVKRACEPWTKRRPWKIWYSFFLALISFKQSTLQTFGKLSLL